MLTLILFAFVLGFAVAFQNPIIPGFNPDPSILRVGKDYFIATSTFEYFPGVPIYHSQDLIKWDVIGHALNRPSQLDMRGTAPSGGIFAPSLRYHDGTYYMITTLFDVINPPDNVTRTPRSFYVSTRNIFDEKSWSEPIYFDQWGFDPDLFWDDATGKVYFTSTFGSRSLGHPDSGYFAIWITEVDLATGDSLSESQFFHESPLPLDTPKLTEGAHIKKINGMYQLITADAGTDVQHRVMHFRSKSITGPWEPSPYNPILFNGHNLSLPILATGHADIVQTPAGDWYAVFLATRPQTPNNSAGHPQLGRETFLAPATWTKDGWLTINGGKDITATMPGLYDLARPKTWREDFKSGKFADKRWYTQRTPYKSFHRFVGGALRLRGNVYTLSDRETPAAFFRKQEDVSTIWSTELSFQPTSKLHEAGVTIFLSTWYHNEVGITLHPDTGVRTIVVKTRSGPDAALSTTYAAIPAQGSVKLFIKAEPHQYSLGYAVGNAEPKYIATVESRWLQAYVQGWQNFVGAHFGVYSTGNQLPILVPADFAYVQTTLL